MNLSELNFENAGSWPAWIKAVAIILLCGLLTGAWYYFLINDQVIEHEKLVREESTLKTTFEAKQAKAINLIPYRQQLQEIEETFGSMLRQLPDRTEVANLLVDVSQKGLSSGLEFTLFQPEAEIQQEFYAELPIKISVLGDYKQFSNFVIELAQLPRIVTIHDVTITPPATAEGKATMQAIVKTYRYIESGGSAEAAKGRNKRR